MNPFVEAVTVEITAGATATLQLGRVPEGATLELLRFSVTFSIQNTLIQPRLLVNGREETRVRLGAAAQGYVGHPGLTLPPGIIIAGGSTLSVEIFNSTAGIVNTQAMLTGRLLAKSAA